MNNGSFNILFHLQLREEEINNLKTDSVRITRQKDIIQRRFRGVEDQKIEIEHQKETLKGQISALERGNLLSNRLARTTVKQVDWLTSKNVGQMLGG